MSTIETTATTATLWGRFELALAGPDQSNPFIDVTFAAAFTHDGRELEASGFYDGDGIYRVRLMPDALGTWRYRTMSNVSALDGREGEFTVGQARPGDHGPVRVADTYHFRYADGTRYINIGTTAYVWNLQGDALEEQTLVTLAEAPFTKIRMCVFPKHYRYNENEPERYPFVMLRRGESAWPSREPVPGWKFDFERFDPAYFRHLEKRIDDLAAIGVEADLILFHPYDRWGFSRMTPEQDDRYLRYVVARLAAFPNVWWSMANEFDFMPTKSLEDWNRFIDTVDRADPHRHLLSVHNGFKLFDHSHKRVTHASLQRRDTERAAMWREKWGKPVSIDECAYEGDISEDWGNIPGRELVHRFWNGVVNGGYVTHGETYYNDAEMLWWAKGGTLKGDSVARIAFLRRILEEGPEEGLDPMPFTGSYRIQKAGGLENLTLAELLGPAPGEEDWPPARISYPTAGQKGRYYLSYFGVNRPREVRVAVPPGERYSGTLIDTLEMTETPLGADLKRGDLLPIPPKPYQALLLRRSD